MLTKWLNKNHQRYLDSLGVPLSDFGEPYTEKTDMSIEDLDLTDVVAVKVAQEEPIMNKQNLGEVMTLVRNNEPRKLPNIEELNKLIEAKNEKLNTLLGCESKTAELLKQQIHDLTRERDKTFFEESYRAEGYLPISFDVLDWRNKAGWPALALFSPSASSVIFKVMPQGSFTYSNSTFPPYPKLIADHYNDVTKKLEKGIITDSQGYWRYLPKIEASFNGVIPDDAREHINKALKQFDQVFLLAEPNFKEGVEIQAIDPDPIVVGWDGFQMWYVYDFDLTPIEEAALLQPYKP